MTLPVQAHNPLTSITAHAQASLAQVAQTPFSAAGFGTLQRRVDEYIEDLVIESVRIMERKQADTVSPSFVQQASDNLVASRKRRLFGLSGTIGGVLLGAALSSYVEMVKASALTLPSVLTASLLGIVGTFLIALQFTRE